MEQALLEHRSQNQNCSGESDKWGRTPGRSVQIALAILARQLEAVKCNSLEQSPVNC